MLNAIVKEAMLYPIYVEDDKEDGSREEFKSDENVIIMNPMSQESDLQRLYDMYTEGEGPGGYQDDSTLMSSYMAMQPRYDFAYKKLNDDERQHRIFKSFTLAKKSK
jgi:hypothetical protein